MNGWTAYLAAWMARWATVGLILVAMTTTGFGQAIEEQTVQAATLVFNEALASPLGRIPESMLADCHGVAIVPNVIKGGFIVGARHGKGLLFVRDTSGIWHAPVFITLTGGNIGWQAGIQSSDIVLVFKTERSINGILSGKMTLGGDAAAAAGPVGRGTSVATDGRLQAEIYTYSRSRGLFAGVSIDGSVLRTDQLSTGSYYQSAAPGLPVVIPPSAMHLTQLIASYANTTVPTVQPEAQLNFAHQQSASEADVLRAQLLQLGPELFESLDSSWQKFLALPLSTFDNSHPSVASVREVLEHYDLIASDPRYRALAIHPEFRSVHGLLKHYEHALEPSVTTLQLPPPPNVPARPGSLIE